MSKKRWMAMLCMLFLLVPNLSGCTGAEESSLVSQKNADRLESTAQKTPEGENTLAAVTAAAPETYTFSWQDEEGLMTITADGAPVILPEAEMLPVIRVSCGEISQELVTAVYDEFFPEGAYRISEGEMVPADAVLEEAVFYDGEETEAFSQGQSLSVQSLDQTRSLWVTSTPSESEQISGIRYTDQSGVYMYTGYSQSDVPLSQAEEEDIAAVGLKPQEAKAVADAFWEAVGVSAEVCEAFLTCGTSTSEEERTLSGDTSSYTGFRFLYMRTVDGIPSAMQAPYINQPLTGDAGSSRSISWQYEWMEVVVDKTGIVYLDWEAPLTVGETASGNVGILNFDTAAAIFEEMLPRICTDSAEQEGVNDSESRMYDIEVTQISLCLACVQGEEDAREGLLLPCWVFYGDEVIRTEGNGSGQEEQIFSSCEPYILLAINAVDGTVVNPKKGF